ncbi:MAG TPA: LPS-assembly protein LptD [Methylotenera sp.]|nr:LPS-assembly protein LptD [Methylotenera sp.]
MLKSRFLTGFTAIFLMFSLRAQADTENIKTDEAADDGITIEGDKLELHLDRQMRSIGNASIHRGKQDVYGDIIDYNVENDELHVNGNVRIEVGGATLSGPDLRMRLSESIGEMRDASIVITQPAKTNPLKNGSDIPLVSPDSVSRNLGLITNRRADDNNYRDTSEFNSSKDGMDDALDISSVPASTHSRGNAKAILFEGQDKKRLVDARYTTCAADVDDWYIKAKELEINDFTDSGTAKHAYVEFKGVPLLYTPWLSFSFNNQRKSGLLAPTFGSTSRSGFELTTPFYWNIAPNMDATLATRVLSKRGIQLQGEFRYLEDTYSGTDNIEYLPSDNQSGENRYYANLKHEQTFGNGWSAGYALEKVSDDQYFSELSTRITTTSRINLPQQFNVNFSNETWAFNGIAQKFQTLDGISYPYERLPQLTLNGNKDYGMFNANLYTQVVEFERNAQAPVAPTGSRFTLYPSISMPMYQPYGYITPKFGIHNTTYNLNNIANNLESQNRTLPIFSLDSGLFFDRDFKIVNRPYTQTFEPRLFYVYIPKHDQSNIPVFDSSDTDLNFATLFNENQYTGNDRINNANQVSLAFTTRFIDNTTGTQRLSASIGQRYYFENQEVTLPGVKPRDSNSSDIIAGVTANLKTSWNIDTFWQYNTDTSSMVRSSITSRYNPEPGKALNLSYSYRQDSTSIINSVPTQNGIDQFNISGQWPIKPGWYGIGRVNYSFRESQMIESLAGVEYDAGCWQARGVIQRVTTATSEPNYALFFQLELGGLASIGANPLNVIKRSVPGYVSSGLIPDNRQQPFNE